MTNEEALYWLKHIRDTIVGIHSPMARTGKTYNFKRVMALDIAIQALEKQIPIRVEEKQVVEDEAFYNLDFLCPACKNAVIGQPYKPSHCKHCGQALKWEE